MLGTSLACEVPDVRPQKQLLPVSAPYEIETQVEATTVHSVVFPMLVLTLSAFSPCEQPLSLQVVNSSSPPTTSL